MGLIYILFYVIVLLGACYGDGQYDDGSEKWPTVYVSVLVRNKEPILPYFLTFLLELDYPKDRLHIWVHSDHNEDATFEILKEWHKIHASDYEKVHMILDFNTKGSLFLDQKHHTEWTPQRYQHMISVKEDALKKAKAVNASYLFMLDADVLLTNPQTLKKLVGKNLPIVAPMLLTDGLYSNFWGGMSKDFYYKRSEDYEELIRRKKQGCFSVPMVHSAVLISLNQKESGNLSYDPKKLKTTGAPQDDIISFALSAKEHGINMTMCNDDVYGFIPIPVDDEQSTESEQVENVQLEVLGRGIDLPVDPALAKFIKYPKKTKYGLNAIYMINLEGRVERKNLMMKSFDILGMDVRLLKAIDGRNFTIAVLNEMGVTLMPGYEDPYHKRSMKGGEVGCFMSHYAIWADIAKNNLAATLILEDDIHFAPFFRERFAVLMSELNDLDWDLVYLGRKVLMDKEEEYVTDHITIPLYSYWTLGYMLSERGARKLINAEPLSKMLPVDEFLPIMFNQHPNATWKSMFPSRQLKAYSASPLLMHPTHYTGEVGYFSDTENSMLTVSHPLNPRSLNEL